MWCVAHTSVVPTAISGGVDISKVPGWGLQKSSQWGLQKLLQELVSHELTTYLSVLDLFLTQWIMAILSKGCKPDNFEPHNSLKLSFTNIWDFLSNFVDCESFLESNSPDIIALCDTNMDDSIDSDNFSMRGYLPLIQKDFTTPMHRLTVYVKEVLPFTHDWSLENSVDSYLCFWMALIRSVSYLYFLYWSPSSSLCTNFGSISSDIDEVLSINPSPNVFVAGDFNAHHKDWLTNSGGTERPGKLCYIFLSQTTLLWWLTFLLRSPSVPHSPAILDLFLSSDAAICSTMAFYNNLYSKLGFESLKFRHWIRKLCAFFKIKTTGKPEYLCGIIPLTNHLILAC